MSDSSSNPSNSFNPILPIDFALPEPNLGGVPLWMSRKPLDPETVAVITEAHRRGRIMSRLRHFAPAIAGFVPARHHELICDGVDELLDDYYDVLVVMSPPASAKSSYISKAAPAYIIGKNPTSRIISVSRGAELATEFGGAVKNIVESAEFINLTGVTLAADTRAKDNWKTTVGGGYFAVGASGGVLGKRADVVICDDIHSSFEDAQSETQLQKIRNWFESDLLSRLTPQGKLIVIGQRLNANDIIGFVMQRALENPAIRIKVLKFQAVAADDVSDESPDLLGRTVPGERMWPEFYTDQYLDDKRRDDFIWRTLWMQEPPSEDGSWVGADDIRIVDIVPEPAALTTYLLSDLALSINKGDYSVHIVVGVGQSGNIFVLHAWRDRCAIEKTVARHLELAMEFKPVESLIDDDNAAKVYVQLLASECRAQSVYVPWKTLPMRGQDKETRNAPLRGLFRNGRIAIKRAPWNEWLVREIMIFPNAMGSGVDDGVDALGLIGRRLIALARPIGDPPPKPAPPDRLQMTLEGLYDEKNRLNNSSMRRRI